MLRHKDVPKAPSLLKGVTVTKEDQKLLGDPFSWAVLNKILIDSDDRLELSKKALLLELSNKKRRYECGRLMGYILQADIDKNRKQANEELEECLT